MPKILTRVLPGRESEPTKAIINTYDNDAILMFFGSVAAVYGSKDDLDHEIEHKGISRALLTFCADAFVSWEVKSDATLN